MTLPTTSKVTLPLLRWGPASNIKVRVRRIRGNGVIAMNPVNGECRCQPFVKTQVFQTALILVGVLGNEWLPRLGDPRRIERIEGFDETKI